MLSSRAWFALAVVGMLGMFCIGAGYGQGFGQGGFGQAGGSRGAPPSGQISRYQMAIVDGAGPGGTQFIAVCDTTSGRCWLRPTKSGEWTDLGTPARGVPGRNPDGADASPRLPVLPPAK